MQNKITNNLVRRLRLFQKILFRYRYQLLTMLVIIGVLVAFVAWYVVQQRMIFFWDLSAYWMKTRGLAEWMVINPKAAFLGVVESVRHDEYNALFAVPLALMTHLFGGSRFVYIFSIFTLYFLPATLLMAAVCHKVIRGMNHSVWFEKWGYVIVWGGIALNPFIVLPAVLGYPDIVGLIPISIALLIYIKHRHEIKISHLLLIALLLLLATFLRRWYIFEAAGLMLAIASDQIVLQRAWQITKQKIVTLLKLTILPITYLSLFIFVAFDYFKQLTTTDYTVKYAAYKFHDDYLELGIFVGNHYGVILSLIAIAGFIGLFRARKVDRQLVVILLVSQVFAFFAVGRVQTFDTHQYYLLTLGLLVGLSAFPYIVNVKKMFVRPILFSAIAIVYLLSWWTMYSNFPTNNGLSDVEAAPQQRSDIATLKTLYSDIEDVSATIPSTDTVYVLACSFVFNIDLFRNIPLSTGDETDLIPNDKFTPTAIFDVAQGFDKSFFTSHVVIDSDPVGYITPHEGEQQVITILHNELRADGRLAPYYKLLKTYDIDNNYTIITYQRVSDIPLDIQNSIIADILATHTEPVPILE
jgi:hypothetical protein